MKALTDSRDAILAGIRGAREQRAEAAIEAAYAMLTRPYEHEGVLDQRARVAMFVERLREYDAHVYEVEQPGLSAKIGEVLHARGVRRMAIPDDLPGEWLPEEMQFTRANALPALDLDRMDGVITACSAAIAVTGTIVLEHGAGQGPRRLSLVPDYHLCLVFAEEVVETVPEAFSRLKAATRSPLTFISGPSATADIEMTRIKGVHGPRFLDVLLVR